MGLHVFISHATVDSELFKLRSLANALKSHSKIDDVMYWEDNALDDTFEWMNINLEKCDLMLVLCSPNAKESVNVRREYSYALNSEKQIIPIFINSSDIPPILTSQRLIRYDQHDHKNLVKNLIDLIEKKRKAGLFTKKNGSSSTIIKEDSSMLKTLKKVY